jgi:hypothetical protein
MINQLLVCLFKGNPLETILGCLINKVLTLSNFLQILIYSKKHSKQKFIVLTLFIRDGNINTYTWLAINREHAKNKDHQFVHTQ